MYSISWDQRLVILVVVIVLRLAIHWLGEDEEEVEFDGSPMKAFPVSID